MYLVFYSQAAKLILCSPSQDNYGGSTPQTDLTVIVACGPARSFNSRETADFTECLNSMIVPSPGIEERRGNIEASWTLAATYRDVMPADASKSAGSLSCSKVGGGTCNSDICVSFSDIKPLDPNPTKATRPALNSHTAAGKGTREVSTPCTRLPVPSKISRGRLWAKEDRLGGEVGCWSLPNASALGLTSSRRKPVGLNSLPGLPDRPSTLSVFESPTGELVTRIKLEVGENVVV